MKHIIVVSTADAPDGFPIPTKLQSVLVRAVEIGVEEGHGPCFVQASFNNDSAIAAAHELYGSPWTPGHEVAFQRMLWTLKDVKDFLRRSGYDTTLVNEAIRSAENLVQIMD